MAASTRLIKRRIKSIQNTKKITKAMELVAASKMKKAVSAVQATRAYANLAWSVTSEIGKSVDVQAHPLLRKTKKISKALVIVIASDRGLAGSYNSAVGRVLAEEAGKMAGVEIDYLTIGKKTLNLIKKINGKLVATFTNLSNNPQSLDIRPIASLAIADFISAKYDKVYLIYTDYYSALRQIARVRQLLPIEADLELGRTVHQDRRENQELRTKNQSFEYLFEPNQKQILDMMLPRIIETQIYQALLESVASEHSARMVAMKNATEAASEIVDDLSFTFNQLRQATITRELAEIAAAKMVAA